MPVPKTPVIPDPNIPPFEEDIAFFAIYIRNIYF